MTTQHRTVDIEAAANLWRTDLSASQIAKRFGVSRNGNRGLFPWRGDAGKKTRAPGVANAAGLSAPAARICSVSAETTGCCCRNHQSRAYCQRGAS